MTELDWTSLADVVEHPIGASNDNFGLDGGGYAISVRGLRTRPGFIEGLGVRVVAGRLLDQSDFVRGSEHAALIGYALWRDRFGSDPGIVGRVIRGEPDSRPGSAETLHVVGVLPRGFFFGRDSTATVDLLIPEPSAARVYMVRLRAGVGPQAAERRITEVVRAAATAPIPADWPGVRLESAYERYAGAMRPVLTGVTIAVGLVLVIVSANVMVLMLLRSLQQQKDTAVRVALGASRVHLARLLLMEMAIVVVGALAAGVTLSAWTLRILAPLIEQQLGRPAPRAAGIGVDATVLGVVAGAGTIIVILIALAPLMGWGRRLMHALRQDGRVATDAAPMRRVRHALIAFEVAGSLVLLIACGLMVRSVSEMMTTDIGFQPAGLSRSRVMLKARKYADAAAFTGFHEAFATRAAERTGSAVAFSSWPPFVEAPSQRIETDAGWAQGGSIAVSAGYFALFKIAMRQGRAFEPADMSPAASTAVVSETLARRLWPNGQALGRRVRLIEQTSAGPEPGLWRTVVGVAADVRQSYDDPDRGDLYTPKLPDIRFGTFYVRSAKPSSLLFGDLRAAAGAIDPEAVINEPRSVADDDQRLAGTTFMTTLLGGLGAVAAFLAMLGMYGVTAYAVQQRRKEVAIRMALGASERAIVGMFLRRGALLLLVGATMGLAGGMALSNVLAHQMFGVRRLDVATFAIASALLLSSGLAATWWPARRAAAARPVDALNAN